MFDSIRSDIRRYTMGRNLLRGGLLVDILFTQGIWALVVYRYGAWLRMVRLPGISFVLKVVYVLLHKMVELATGISISSGAAIGPGLYIGHFGGIFVNSSARIGRNCSIGAGVVIGSLGLGKQGAPRIGDNVFIGVGAKVLGNIEIGSNARIGANAVVISNVPEGATVVGIPARVVRRRGTVMEVIDGIKDVFA